MNWIHRRLCRSGWWKKRLEREYMPWALKDAALGGELLEVGPGPGLTTDVLRGRFARVTSIEIDTALAASLSRRLRGTNVKVIEGDATSMPFADRAFSGAVCFTMLHHVPSPALQDRLFAEVCRVLRPGGVFLGTDSRWTRLMPLLHVRDTLVLVDPKTVGARLERAGFRNVAVEVTERAFRFLARRE